MNQELLKIFNISKQMNYLHDLENVFEELEDKFIEENTEFAKQKIELLSKIFIIQIPIFMNKHKSYWPWNKSKNNKLYQGALQYVFSHEENIQEELTEDNCHYYELINYNELHYDLETLKELNKIGLDKLEDILIDREDFSKLSFYNENIEQICKEHNINKERFESIFERNYSLYFLNRNIAYHFEDERIKEHLKLDFNLGAELCSSINNFLLEHHKDLFSNEILINKITETKDIIDWNIVINGQEPDVFHYFIENCEEKFLFAVIRNNLELFEKNIKWILEEASKTKCIIDIELLISKISSNKKLNDKLQPKNTTKTKVNKI